MEDIFAINLQSWKCFRFYIEKEHVFRYHRNIERITLKEYWCKWIWKTMSNFTLIETMKENNWNLWILVPQNPWKGGGGGGIVLTTKSKYSSSPNKDLLTKDHASYQASIQMSPQERPPSYQARFQMCWYSKLLLNWLPRERPPVLIRPLFSLKNGWSYKRRATVSNYNFKIFNDTCFLFQNQIPVIV